jgi:hypothetical protein
MTRAGPIDQSYDSRAAFLGCDEQEGRLGGVHSQFRSYLAPPFIPFSSADVERLQSGITGT